jgi:hypothetical protein
VSLRSGAGCKAGQRLGRAGREGAAADRGSLKGFPTVSYYTDFAGSPAYVHSHGIGIASGVWRADWPNGYAFLNQLSNGSTITPTSNVNISELNDPAINSLFSQAQKSPARPGQRSGPRSTSR